MYTYSYISKHYKFEPYIESSPEIILHDLLCVTVTRKKNKILISNRLKHNYIQLLSNRYGKYLINKLRLIVAQGQKFRALKVTN